MRFLTSALVLLPLTVGCYSEARFQKDATTVYCNRVFECAEGDNVTLALLQLLGWDDAEDCIEEEANDAWSAGDDCLYDASIARTCVQLLEEGDCGDAVPGTCSDVYDCD